MKLSALVMSLLTLAACAASHSSRPETPWRVEVVSSGGFAGRGAGNYAIDSDGNITVRTMDGKSCSYEATAEEMERFIALLGASKPGEWQGSYAPENRCCDRIEYTLTLVERGVASKTEWIDDPLPRPPDLVALADALIGGAPTSIRTRSTDRCR